MCGRFTHYHNWAQIREMYRLIRPADTGRNTSARFNIAPTQTVPFVHLDQDGNQIVEEGRWWLVPFWAKEIPKATLFNARIETADTTPAYRDAFKSKHCLIPADGFYEWTVSEEDGKKDPWFIHLPDQQPFSFAGLWAHNDKLGITSCTILTEDAQDPMTKLHTRQPIILARSAYDAWLASDTSPQESKAILKNTLDGDLQFHRVTRDVNSSRFGGDLTTINPL